MRNLILGIVDNYSFYQISRFLITLRQTDFSGHVCLFAGPRVSRWTRRRLRALGVEVIPYRDAFPFIASPHPDAPAALPQPIHIYNFRHFLYLDYLLKHGSGFANVLLSDVKDVVFQADPFAFPLARAIHVAMENPAIPLGQCPSTAPWLLAGYDAAVLESIGHQPMSCAGTTIAPVELMKRYLVAMLGEVAGMKDAVECADQAAHNVLLHGGRLEPVRRLDNFRGPILTVGSEPEYRTSPAGELVNEDGSVINIVHQYDRHPELVAAFERRIRPNPLRRGMARALHEVERRLRPRWQRLGARLKGSSGRSRD